jgi:hypothetical protein
MIVGPRRQAINDLPKLRPSLRDEEGRAGTNNFYWALTLSAANPDYLGEGQKSPRPFNLLNGAPRCLVRTRAGAEFFHAEGAKTMKREETVMSLHFTQFIGHAAAEFIALLLAVFFIQVGAQAQTTPTPQERECFNAVQGRVAWNQAGSKQWNETNIRDLCRGTRNPSETIACFQRQIQSQDDWKKATAACNKSQPVTGATMTPPAATPAPAGNPKPGESQPRRFPETYRSPLTLGPVVASPLLTIDNFYVRDATATTALVPVLAMEDKSTRGKAIEFTINGIPNKRLEKSGGGAVDQFIGAVAHLVLRPKAVYMNGLLYLHLSTADSSIEISPTHYVNTGEKQGWYIHSIDTKISYDANKFERLGWGLQNTNNKGQLTDMSSLTLCLKLDLSSYTVGTSWSREISEFLYVDQSSAVDGVVGGSWTLTSQFGPQVDRDAAYHGVGRLKAPPALAYTTTADRQF